MYRQVSKDPYLSLLQRTASGDRNAFAALYKNTVHRITVYLYRLVDNRDIVEDILAQTYIEVWKHSNSFKEKSQVITWMIGISRNIALRELGKQKYHENIEEHPQIPATGIDLNRGNTKQILQKALHALSADHREILELAFYQDLPYKEIASLLAIPAATVKTRVFYAKGALKNMLAHMGIYYDDL